MSQFPTPEQIEEGLRSDRDLWKAIALRQEQIIETLRERNAELEAAINVDNGALEQERDRASSELAELRKHYAESIEARTK
jgi:hypothetical protein